MNLLCIHNRHRSSVITFTTRSYAIIIVILRMRFPGRAIVLLHRSIRFIEELIGYRRSIIPREVHIVPLISKLRPVPAVCGTRNWYRLKPCSIRQHTIQLRISGAHRFFLHDSTICCLIVGALFVLYIFADDIMCFLLLCIRSWFFLNRLHPYIHPVKHLHGSIGTGISIRKSIIYAQIYNFTIVIQSILDEIKLWILIGEYVNQRW